MSAKLKKLFEDNIVKISVSANIIGSLIYVAGLIEGVVDITRLGALLFACGATAYIVEDSSVPRPRGTTMVSMAAFMLILEGSARFMTTGIDETSYYLFVLGLYLMVTLWQMIKPVKTK
jgi:hypothetical protein